MEGREREIVVVPERRSLSSADAPTKCCGCGGCGGFFFPQSFFGSVPKHSHPATEEAKLPRG